VTVEEMVVTSQLQMASWGMPADITMLLLLINKSGASTWFSGG
jgi:hypothetical protein